MLSGGPTCRGRDENSNGLCSCGLPRSEALRVASPLATALTTAATPLAASIQEVQSSTPQDPCRSDRVVVTARSNETHLIFCERTFLLKVLEAFALRPSYFGFAPACHHDHLRKM